MTWFVITPSPYRSLLLRYGTTANREDAVTRTMLMKLDIVLEMILNNWDGILKIQIPHFLVSHGKLEIISWIRNLKVVISVLYQIHLLPNLHQQFPR